MKRSASLSFDKEILKEGEVEHLKKITKSVESKKSAKKLHEDTDAFPSPVGN